MVDANVKIIEELKSFLNGVIEIREIRELFITNPSDFIRENGFREECQRLLQYPYLWTAV